MAKTQTQTQTTGTDLVPLEQEVGTDLAELVAQCPHVSLVGGDVDPRDAMLAIVGRLLSAESLAEANAVTEGGGLSSRDLADSGQVFTIEGMRIAESTYVREDGSRGWYGQYDAVNADGERVLITSSSLQAMAAVISADAHGLLPAQAEFVSAEQTPRGFRPINLRWVTEA